MYTLSRKLNKSRSRELSRAFAGQDAGQSPEASKLPRESSANGQIHLPEGLFFFFIRRVYSEATHVLVRIPSFSPPALIGLVVRKAWGDIR